MERTIVNPVIKDQVTFKQTAKATKGSITRLEVTLMPGGGTPLHYHRNFSETFIVQSGTLTIQLKKEHWSSMRTAADGKPRTVAPLY